MKTSTKPISIHSIKEHMAHLHTLDSFARALVEAMCVSAMDRSAKANPDGSIDIPVKASILPAPIERGGCTKEKPCMEFCLEIGGARIHYNLGMGCQIG